jgi:hypothetical protein
VGSKTRSEARYPCMSMFTPLFDFLTRQNTSHQQSDFFKGNGTRCRRGSFVLGLREHETLEAAERSRFLCPRNSIANQSVVLRPLQSLNWNNLKQPYSIRLLLHSRRSYEYAIERFIAWYCDEPRLAFNRSVVVRYRSFLESLSLSAATINRSICISPRSGGWLMRLLRAVG